MGVGYEQFGRERAEVIVDTAAHLACSSVGLMVDGETVPYVAGWGEDGALEAVSEYAKTIDELARRIENVLTADTTSRAAGGCLSTVARKFAHVLDGRTHSLLAEAGARSAPTETTACRPKRASATPRGDARSSRGGALSPPATAELSACRGGRVWPAERLRRARRLWLAASSLVDDVGSPECDLRARSIRRCRRRARSTPRRRARSEAQSQIRAAMRRGFQSRDAELALARRRRGDGPGPGAGRLG
jgi:hypothetical protein